MTAAVERLSVCICDVRKRPCDFTGADPDIFNSRNFANRVKVTAIHRCDPHEFRRGVVSASACNFVPQFADAAADNTPDALSNLQSTFAEEFTKLPSTLKYVGSNIDCCSDQSSHDPACGKRKVAKHASYRIRNVANRVTDTFSRTLDSSSNCEQSIAGHLADSINGPKNHTAKFIDQGANAVCNFFTCSKDDIFGGSYGIHQKVNRFEDPIQFIPDPPDLFGSLITKHPTETKDRILSLAEEPTTLLDLFGTFHLFRKLIITESAKLEFQQRLDVCCIPADAIYLTIDLIKDLPGVSGDHPKILFRTTAFIFPLV